MNPDLAHLECELKADPKDIMQKCIMGNRGQRKQHAFENTFDFAVQEWRKMLSTDVDQWRGEALIEIWSDKIYVAVACDSQKKN